MLWLTITPLFRIYCCLFLTEYLTDNQWKSVALDDVTIKLKPDDTVYLHNYRDKFERLGLRWTIDGGLVSVTAIPEAIIGKNARQVNFIASMFGNS